MRKLIGLLLFGVLLFGVLGCSSSKKADMVSIEKDLYNLINAERTKLNLSELVYNENLAKQAKLHSDYMAENFIINHDNFNQRLTASNVKFINAQELVGKSIDAQSMLKTWIQVVADRETLETDFDLIGIGVVKQGTNYYFTAVLIKSE